MSMLPFQTNLAQTIGKRKTVHLDRFREARVGSYRNRDLKRNMLNRIRIITKIKRLWNLRDLVAALLILILIPEIQAPFIGIVER